MWSVALVVAFLRLHIKKFKFLLLLTRIGDFDELVHLEMPTISSNMY